MTVSYLLLASMVTISAQSVQDRLSAIPQVAEVQPLENSIFPQKYVLKFTQPIDHDNPAMGTFTQRVFVGDIHPDSITVLVCEGYQASYAQNPKYRDEISKLFNTNNIVVEHRYFGESKPFPEASSGETDWTWMTGRQESEDLHAIVTALKSIYHGKWVSTGISKGGQNTMIYRAHFPEDVDVSVPYVGPLCRALEDGRHEPFIAGFCGTAADRKAVKNFQIDLLKNRDSIQPLMESLAKEKNMIFNAPMDEIYDYCVLEFSFAFWQWGMPVNTIPGAGATAQEKFDFMVKASGPDYLVNDSGFTPFHVQAAKELGYYGYDTKPFRKWLHLKSAEGYFGKLFLPKGQEFVFSGYIYDKVSTFLKETDARMLFIYGEFDPWSAVKVDDPGHDNIYVFVQKGGSHRTRIATFDEPIRNEIKGILTGWLYR